MEIDKDYTGYKLLTTMLATKFSEEFNHLSFKPIKGTITNEYNINGEIYVTNSSVDALEVSNKSGGRYTLYLTDCSCHRIPKIFDIEDFILIYKTICMITGKPTAVYQDSIADAITIEPYINLY